MSHQHARPHVRRSAGRWVLAAVAVPVAMKALSRVSRSIQERRGNTSMMDAIQKAASGRR